MLEFEIKSNELELKSYFMIYRYSSILKIL